MLHDAVQPGDYVLGHLRLTGQFDECFLHAIVGRIGPLRCVERERGPVLIQKPPQ